MSKYVPQIGDHVKANDNVRSITGLVIAVEPLFPSGFGAAVLVDSNVPSNSFVSLKAPTIKLWQDRGFDLMPDIQKYLGQYYFWFEDRYCTLLNQPVITAQQHPKKREIGDCNIDGAACVKCREVSVYAAPGFTCYSCRMDPYRLSRLNVDDPVA